MCKFIFKRILSVATIAAVAGLSACGGKGDAAPDTAKNAEPSPAMSVSDVLDMAIAGEWRAENKARDQYRNPKATLEFFNLSEGDKVAEIWPGWYTEILAPFAKHTGGEYTAVLYAPSMGDWVADRTAKFKETYSDADIYGDVAYATFAKDGLSLADNSMDKVLTFRNLHNWMGQNYADTALSEFYRVLKPGGTLGIVEHRLPESAEQDVRGRTGYVQESYMKALAADAGFEFVSSSEVNANPKDSADHPFGVWTLKPRLRKPKADDPAAATFDAAKYEAIGESDRFTMIFKKPE